MDFNQRRLALSGALLLSIPLAYAPAIYAAKPIDLSHQNVSVLQSIISPRADQTGVKLVETKRSIDFNKTLHIRVQQTYAGYPVFGGDAILHVPNGAKTKSLSDAAASAKSMDGVIYQDLNADLAKTPATVFTQDQAQKALQRAIDNYAHKIGGQPIIKNQQSKLIVYIDKNNKSHWAYQTSFYAQSIKAHSLPAKPVSIMDADSLSVYEQWDDIKTDQVDAAGGGFGGNLKLGKLVYDGMTGNLAKLNIQRDVAQNVCYLMNNDVIVQDANNKYVTENFPCATTNKEHNDVYWSADIDKANGGYSPGNDALFGGAVIKDMYQKWYNIPVLTNQDGTPMKLTMAVHDWVGDNAYWDGEKMNFGDGSNEFYPFTSLGIAAHEISHGFTEQHSNLVYNYQSGGMNEAFSDMAAQAAEYFAYGKSSWLIGAEIFKTDDTIRFMDQPSRDCYGHKIGEGCSIDNANQYDDSINVHYTSGVYNRFFYLLATSPGWNVKKAFDVMVHANANYWTARTNYIRGACGVVRATRDFKYNEDSVHEAFNLVGINTDYC